jgi:iron(III) transport system ATP-binding protein
VSGQRTAEPEVARHEAPRRPGSGVSDRPTRLFLERITKIFGDFTALRDICLEVYDGEFLVLLGPSGCGKTTLLRIIAGLETQTAGLITQSGREISALPPSKRDFGIVFQSYALFPNLTVFKNVAYGLQSAGVRRADVEKRVTELLDLAGLSTERDKYPAQLSGGQQQRVAVLRALAIAPGLLLLDEPLSALDARVRASLRHELKRIQRRLGVTTVMVTHDQAEALTVADRIVVMNHGGIVQVGTAQEIYQSPMTPFVADFIGTTNFLRGSVVGRDRVRVGDRELACRMDGIPDAEEVTVAVRAEDIVLADAAASGSAFVGQVVELSFIGSFVRVTLSASALGSAHLTADFAINSVRERPIAVGDTLSVAILEKYVRAFLAP